jgi:tetratricopeptide (TPR) repeat protein
VSARLSTLMADPEAARAKAMRALGILEALGPSRALALCYSTLGSQDTLQARFEVAIGWSKRALDLAERIGSPEVVSHALGHRGVARASLGDDGGLADLERAVETADRLGHGDYLNVAAHNLAVVLIRSGRLREARDHLDIGERAAREYGLDTGRFRIEAQQCHVLLLQGTWDEAERRLRRLLERAGDPGPTWSTRWPSWAASSPGAATPRPRPASTASVRTASAGSRSGPARRSRPPWPGGWSPPSPPWPPSPWPATTTAATSASP